MQLTIDGVVLNLASEDVHLPLFNASKLRSVEAWREGARVELRVAATASAVELFGNAEELHKGLKFNDTYHRGVLMIDGVRVIEGVVSLLGVERDNGTRYRIAIRSGGADWADSAALTMLVDSDIESQRVMDLGSIVESWSDDGAVRMLPMFRDSYPEAEDTGLYIAQHTLLPQEYHPFISVRAIVDSVVGGNGYELHSRFLDTAMAKKLVLSGAYKRVECAQANATMGFKAMRSKTATAAASQIGRIDAWGSAGGSYLGYVVDTVDATTVCDDGTPCSEAYATGGCFRFEAGRPKFYPRREVSVAFDIHLHYTTDYRMVSSKRLMGFDRLYLGNECYVDVELRNHYRDLRSEVVGGIEYRLVIFDYDPESLYLLGGYGEITGPETVVVFDEGCEPTAALYVKAKGGRNYQVYFGDWALYGGYVAMEGRREVNITIRTPYETLTPTSPKVFDQLYFYGAEQGMQLTLHAGCSIVPIFGAAAGYGERLEFRDVANHAITQAQLLDAVAHMFNLRIYSHEASRRLYVEPYDDFYDGEVVDWRDRQLDDGVEIEECAADSFMVTTLSYQPSDGATARLTEGDGALGVWSDNFESYAAKQSVDLRLNPCLVATASMCGAVGVAPSAEVMMVGERDVVDGEDYVAPRIALYHGIVPLAKGEWWPTSGNAEGYPLVAFHSAAMGESLCFEDRDECRGLHAYYDKELREKHTREMLTTSLRLPVVDYVALFDPDAEGATIRSRFRLSVGGNSSIFRLEEMLSYDAAKGVARCRFQRLTSD